MDSSEQLRNPRGLIYGLLSVALGQIFVVIPYYYLLRKQYIKRPFIQQKFEEEYKRREPSPSGRNSWDEESTFLSEMKNHLFQLEGFFLLGTYLSVTWIFNLMPETYYDLDQPVKFLDVLLQLLVVDFFQTIMHFGEHYVANFYIKSHKPHHVFKSPRLFDAFDGSFMDTICMILIPLYLTANIVRTNMWSYAAFGTIYGNYLCLIHSEYSHSFDPVFRMLGIGTAGDHHVHHKLFKYNYGHLFMIWDRFLFGTYKSPLELKKHFNVSQMRLSEKDILAILNIVAVISFPLLSRRVYENISKTNATAGVAVGRKHFQLMPKLTDTRQVAELGLLVAVAIYFLGFSGITFVSSSKEDKGNGKIVGKQANSNRGKADALSQSD